MKLSNISGKFSVECEIADSPWRQAVGLGFSGKRRNMLFTFPIERSWEFWMFGMIYGLKIIFIDGRKRVIETQEAEPLSLNPKTWKVYAPKKPCKYVLEVPIMHENPSDFRHAEKRSFSCNSKYKFEKGEKLKW